MCFMLCFSNSHRIVSIFHFHISEGTFLNPEDESVIKYLSYPCSFYFMRTSELEVILSPDPSNFKFLLYPN